MPMVLIYWRGNINSVKKITGSLLDLSKETGIQINSVKTKYTFTSRQSNAVKIIT
jgi:hypothetical protein